MNREAVAAMMKPEYQSNIDDVVRLVEAADTTETAKAYIIDFTVCATIEAKLNFLREAFDAEFIAADGVAEDEERFEMVLTAVIKRKWR